LFVNKTGIAKNSEKKHFEKITKGLDEKSLKAMKEAKQILDNTEKEGVFGHIKKLGAIGTFMENINSSMVKDKKAEKGFMKILNKVWDALLSTRYSRNIIVGITGATLTGIVGSLIGLKLQKASARAGRYKAKQEIASDPRNFVGYSEKDFEEVKDVKGQKKTFGQKVKETVTFIPRVIGDYLEYEKFRKTEAKQDKKLLGELVKLDVTDEQLKEAKDLQRKVFTTFENVDDKSQEYSESIEAMTEMTAPILPYAGIAITSLPIVVALIKTLKGGSAHATEVITGFLAKHTNFLKGKTVKKILGEVKGNIPQAVSGTKLSSSITEGGDLPEIDPKLQQMAIEETKKSLSILKEGLNNFKGKINKNVDTNGIGDGVKALEEFSKEFDEYSTIRRVIEKIIESGLTETQLQNICSNLEIIYNNLSPKEIKEIFDCVIEQLVKEPEKCMKLITSGNISKIFASKTAINTAAIAGGTWTALTLLLTYALEATFAGMQKNAGKLGVMTALNELSDERYYANENPTTSQNSTAPATNPISNETNKAQSEMLKKMLVK